MEHTQGEWVVLDPTKTANNKYCIAVKRNSIMVLAEVRHNFPFTDEVEANAKLIAAAPDMLEACKLALVVLRGLDSSALVIPILEETINKATK